MTHDQHGFTRYRRTQIAELRPYSVADDLTGVSISEADRKAGSPKPGDMIARNPANHADQWLVSAAYFADNFEPLAEPVTLTVRRAARMRSPLDGADAQALEGALQHAEREIARLTVALADARGGQP